MAKVKKSKKTSEDLQESASPIVTSKKVKKTRPPTIVEATKTLKSKKKLMKSKAAEINTKSVVPVESPTTKKNKRSKNIGKKAVLSDKAKSDVASKKSTPEKRKRDKEDVGGKVSNKKKIRSAQRVFIGNFDNGTSDKVLEQKMSAFGDVLQISLPKNAKKQNKGYGFVDFADKESKRKALKSNGLIVIKDRKLIIQEAERNHENELYFKNVPTSVNGALLKNHFSRFGKVVQVMMQIDTKTGLHKGYGFMSFKNESNVKAALSADHKIRGTSFLVKLPESGGKIELAKSKKVESNGDKSLSEDKESEEEEESDEESGVEEEGEDNDEESGVEEEGEDNDEESEVEEESDDE